MLPKPFRLPSHRIPELIAHGKRYHDELFSLIVVLKNSADTGSQFAVIVPSKLSKQAVKRNRTKRLLVEALHHQLPHIIHGFDVIIMARKIFIDEKLPDIAPHITHVLTTTGLVEK